MRAPSVLRLLIRALPLVLLVGGTLSLAGCRKPDPSLSRLREAGVLRVGIDPSWPPFEFVDPERGELAGLDVDLARSIGRRLEVEVVFVPSGWEGLYSALFAGQFDAIISALPYDPWRTQEALYSTSYFNAGPVIVVHGANSRAVIEAKDLAGRTVHVEFGSEGHVQARRLEKSLGGGTGGLSIQRHETAEAALTALMARPGDVAIVDHVSARLFQQQGHPLSISGEPLYDELYVVAVHPSARALQQAVDQALIDMRESGELEALIDRWL